MFSVLVLYIVQYIVNFYSRFLLKKLKFGDMRAYHNRYQLMQSSKCL